MADRSGLVTESTVATQAASPPSAGLECAPAPNGRVLSELTAEVERERRRRQEAESKLKAREADERMLRNELVILRKQRDSFMDIVEALTSDNSAVAFASASPSETLPLHEIRLLEIMPWDERVQEGVAKKIEELHEWQIWDSESKTWRNGRQSFPDDFKSLPVTKVSGEKNGNWRKRLEPGPDALVLTNAACTHIMNVEDGYPLPSRGTWNWIGSWKVELHRIDGLPCDKDGWTYAAQPKLFLSKNASSSNGCFDRATPDCSEKEVRKFRRRIWTRPRVLTSYPSISERTECCLHVLAKNACLERSACKVADQLLETQDALLHSQEVNKELQHRIDEAADDLKKAEEKIQSLERPHCDTQSSDTETKATGRCRVEAADIEPTKSRSRELLRQWHDIIGAKNAPIDDISGSTEPSTPDDESVRSQTDNLDESVPLSEQIDDRHDAYHWKIIDGGGALLDRIVSNIPAKAKVASNQKVMLESLDELGEEPWPKPEKMVHFCHPTVKY